MVWVTDVKETQSPGDHELKKRNNPYENEMKNEKERKDVPCRGRDISEGCSWRCGRCPIPWLGVGRGRPWFPLFVFLP